MQDEEQQIAIGGAFDRRAGCLLTPLIPVRAAGVLIVTGKRVIFDPVLHYKLVARKWTADLDEVSGAEASGSRMELNIMDLVAVGKLLTVRLKNGASRTFRSMEADQLAEAINRLTRRGSE